MAGKQKTELVGEKGPEILDLSDQPSDPTRCGGYRLTNEGWVLDTDDEK